MVQFSVIWDSIIMTRQCDAHLHDYKGLCPHSSLTVTGGSLVQYNNRLSGIAAYIYIILLDIADKLANIMILVEVILLWIRN